jgi:2-polyprenyl-3-methyl-5-hydroxy-6-metoxy-1,4-benzoquinol methylase
VKCAKCDLAFTNPIPEIERLSEYYKSEEYISHTNNSKGWFNKLYKIARRINIKSKLKIIGKKKGKLLEIGSGTGDLLFACKNLGWETTGIEPNERARNNAKQNLNLILNKNINNIDLKNKSQDIIMMWHVLEHIPNLKETTTQIRELLKDNGKLIIAVPNHKSFDAKYYKENWAAYDVPRHLLHFDKETMSKTLKKSGLRVIKTKAMIFDSFYVSMLSEKIKTGKKNPIKAIFIALWSNIKAFVHNKEYSSIIYIVKKDLKEI